MNAPALVLNREPGMSVAHVEALMETGQNWEATLEFERDKSNHRAWMCVWASWLITGLAVAALVIVATKKNTTTVVLEHDTTAHSWQLLKGIDDRTIVGYDELNAKHWVTQYVIAHESYLWQILQGDYDRIRALSTEDVARAYAVQFEGSEAKHLRLGENVEERIHIISVTFPPTAGKSTPGHAGQAVVRFDKTVKRTNAQGEPPKTYVATLAYKFEPSMFGTEEALAANPLGFKVTAYRVDAEMPGSEK
jgi:type IV secretion system protein VirB8